MRRPGASRAKPAIKPSAPAARGVRELREHQAELEIQNQALRYSQAAAEGATERFLTLFSNVPLALMLVDENSLVLESNAMALRLLRPLEQDPPLNFCCPLSARRTPIGSAPRFKPRWRWPPARPPRWFFLAAPLAP